MNSQPTPAAPQRNSPRKTASTGNRLPLALAMGALLAAAAPARVFAWDAPGHILVTRLAVAGLPDDFPAWAKEPAQVEHLCYLCVDPDRWRSQKAPALDHINNPDHYLDAEELEVYSLDIRHLPRFRNEFIEMLAAFRALHPGVVPPPSTNDTAHVHSVPGLLPYAIEENRCKIASSWSTLRTFEAYPDVVTHDELAGARNDVIEFMGLLSHFVGDAHQPLHLTQHHHGWVGDNPHHYTTNKSFHAFIDAGVIDLHHLTIQTLRDQARPATTFDPMDDWDQILRMLERSNELVEPLYKLEKSGRLMKEEGKAFIADRLLEGGADLAGLWVAAYKASAIDPYIALQLDARRAAAASRSPNSPPPASSSTPTEKGP